MRRVAAAAIGLALVACASDGRDAAGGCAVPETAASPPTTEPEIVIPDGPAPDSLQTDDLIVGTGTEVVTGCEVSVHYVGALYDTGEEFGSSWEGGVPLDLQLGQGVVIPGWELGIIGMRVGGRRQLIIPPDQGYGAEGRPGIPPNATLVFVVDLLAIKETPG